MNTYQKLIIENSNNPQNIEIINNVVGEALYYMGLRCDYSIKTSDITPDGLLEIKFVEGQEIEEGEVITELSEIFYDEFNSIMKMEHSELT
jgi:hypothetical protein